MMYRAKSPVRSHTECVCGPDVPAGNMARCEGELPFAGKIVSTTVSPVRFQNPPLMCTVALSLAANSVTAVISWDPKLMFVDGI